MLRRLMGLGLALCLAVLSPQAAWAESGAEASRVAPEVEVSAEGDAARIEGCDFAAEAFECSRTGSARAVDLSLIHI